MSACRTLRRVSGIVYFIGVVAVLLYLVVFPDVSGEAVRNSLAVCGKRLIPSLLPFLVVSRLIGNMGVSESVTTAFLTGAVSGFPVGATMISHLCKQQKLSRDDAAFAVAVSDNAGIAFCVGGIGAAIFHQTTVGWQIYACQIAADLLILALCRKHRQSQIKNSPRPNLSPSKLLSLTANAVADSGLTMLKICAFAVVFAVVGEPIVTGVSKVSTTAAAVFASVWELTLAGEAVAAVIEGGQTAVAVGKIIAAFAVGFGGVSVQMQIAAIVSPIGISMKPCLILKLCQGILSAILMSMIVLLST